MIQDFQRCLGCIVYLIQPYVAVLRRGIPWSGNNLQILAVQGYSSNQPSPV